MIVNSWGLHFAPGDIGFLMQPGVTQTLYEGVDCPFTVAKLPIWCSRTCPHSVDLKLADDAAKHLIEDPLVRWFLDPTSLAAVPSTPDVVAMLDTLSYAYAAVRPLVAPVWVVTNRTMNGEGRVTNLCPWILLDVESNRMRLIDACSRIERPTLLVLKQNIPLPPGSVRLTTELQPSDLDPLKLLGLGAWAVRKRMMKEPIR